MTEELLQLNAVGSFMAAVRHIDVGALGPPLRLVSQLVMSFEPVFASQFVAAGGLETDFANKCDLGISDQRNVSHRSPCYDR